MGMVMGGRCGHTHCLFKKEMSTNAYHSVKVCNLHKKTHRQFFSSLIEILWFVCIRTLYINAECSTHLKLKMIL